MEWNIHWQCCFESIGGVQYAVNIYDRDYDGDVIQLTGSSYPFVTQEDDDEDVISPVRTQSGYLRVIDFDGTLLEQLIPGKNTDRLVRLVKGRYDGDWPHGRFVQDGGNDSVKWRGFLQANAYTQPWENNAFEVSIPVKSLLGTLDDVYLQDSYFGGESSVAKLIVDSFNLLGENPSGLSIISNLNDAENDFLNVYVETAVFFSEISVQNEGNVRYHYVSNSFLDVLSSIASLFGMCFREHSGMLYAVMYDTGGGTIGMMEIPYWNQLEQISSGGSFGSFMYNVPETSLLDFFHFSGSGNTSGFVYGSKNAFVELNLGGISFHVQPHPVDVTADAPMILGLLSGTLYVQPHRPNASEEKVYYSVYNRTTYIGESNYDEVLNHTVINGYVSNPYVSTNYNLYTGAFPCRWFFQASDKDSVILIDGLYFNSQYLTSNFRPTQRLMYSLHSNMRLDCTDGWLVIDFIPHNLIVCDDQAHVHALDEKAREYYGSDVRSEFHFGLRVGNLYWNGSGWTTDVSQFSIICVNGQINSNKPSNANVNHIGGYWIPTYTFSGYVDLYLYDYVSVSTGNPPTYRYCYSHILESLEVFHVRDNEITASERSKNTYYKWITSGFSGEKRVILTIGTKNNNLPYPCFLKRNDNTYIEKLSYSNSSMRPEQNLLDRIVLLFGKIRRTFKANVEMRTSDFLTFDEIMMRFSYIGRHFFCVKSQTNWRDDTEDVKFIETE